MLKTNWYNDNIIRYVIFYETPILGGIKWTRYLKQSVDFSKESGIGLKQQHGFNLY